jgi:hypothetical protein
MKLIISILFVVILLSNQIYSQDIGSKLGKVSSEYAKQYITPLNDALSFNFNSGLFYDANIPFSLKSPFHLNIAIGIKMMSTFFTNNDKSFSMNYNDYGIANNQQVLGVYSVTNAPTFIGEKRAPVAQFTYNGVRYPENDKELIKGVTNFTILPLALPEIRIGSVYGSDLTFSLFPKININNMGYVGYYAFALRHNVNHIIDNFTKVPLPVDLAVQVGYQKFFVEDSNNSKIVSSRDYFANIQVSKTYSIFTGFAGVQYENFVSDVNYSYTDGAGNVIPISFSLTGPNHFRGIIGGSLKYGYFVFHAEANISNKFGISSGLGFCYD